MIIDIGNFRISMNVNGSIELSKNESGEKIFIELIEDAYQVADSIIELCNDYIGYCDDN